MVYVCLLHRSCSKHRWKISCDHFCPKCQNIVSVEKTYPAYHGDIYLGAGDTIIGFKFFSNVFNMKHANQDRVEEKLAEDYTGKTAIIDFDGSLALENEGKAIAVKIQIKDD